MESREEMVMLAEGGQLAKSGSNLTEAIGSPVREPQGKSVHRSCLSPGAAPYSRDRTEEVEESARRNMSADMRPVGMSSSSERHRTDHPHKDGSSSDTESDFYEEIDVSCTPESMDYPTAKGRFENTITLHAGFVLFAPIWLIRLIKCNNLIVAIKKCQFCSICT